MNATIFYRDGSKYTIGNVTNYENHSNKVEFYTSKYIQPGGIIVDSNVIIKVDSDVLYIVVKDFGSLVEILPGTITKFDVIPNATQLKELKAQDEEIQRLKDSRVRRRAKNTARFRAHIKAKELARQNKA